MTIMRCSCSSCGRVMRQAFRAIENPRTHKPSLFCQPCWHAQEAREREAKAESRRKVADFLKSLRVASAS